MFDPKVITSYSIGTIINLDANDALNFMIGLSINVINTIKSIKEETDSMGSKITVDGDPYVMHLIEYYNSGSPEAIYHCVLQTNVSILYSFIENITLNGSSRGLFLFCHNGSRINNVTVLDLIIKALEDAHEYYLKYGSDSYKNNPSNYFDRYNKEFLELVNGR